jgi:hypothetical protein
MAALLMFISAPSLGWGELGHQLVGALAQRQLTPGAKARIHELLRNEPVPTLAGVAMWADDLSVTDPERFKATSRWHYVNIGEGSCHFVASRDCADGACVVGAIEAQTRLLRDSTQPLEVRRDALKFIVHFVGDVHQPLHSSDRKDRGGNDFQISLRTDTPPGIMATNLHAVWDLYIPASAKLELVEYADRLAAASRAPTPRSGAVVWARESCELIEQRALYPPTHKMDAKYLVAMRPLAEQRIALAANRLARLLNEVLGTEG